MIHLNVGRAFVGAVFGFLFLVCSGSASAQATRTWVSGVGDDVNPCSRTAPCKTFSGAISKTAAGGEINCLDPAGYGAVTITKSLTISCPYTEGGSLAGGNAIVVNAGATDVVYLRGLDIFGVNPPSNGVRFIAGAALHIEDSVIRRFNAVNSQGISFQPSGTSSLFISNTTVAENGNAATGGGILIQPTGTGRAMVSMRNVRVRNNANNGIRIDSTGNTSGRITAVLDDVDVSGNANGIRVVDAAGVVPENVVVRGSTIVGNGLGIVASGPAAVARVSETVITANTTGVSTSGGATIFSFGDNILEANPDNVAPTNGAFTGAIQPKK